MLGLASLCMGKLLQASLCCKHLCGAQWRTLQDSRLDTAWAKPGGANLPQEGGKGLQSSLTRCVPAQRKLNSITTCRCPQLTERRGLVQVQRDSSAAEQHRNVSCKT